MHDTLKSICGSENPSALAVIINQIGAAYRPLGAVMAIYNDGRHVGHVSSGCIEADIIHHAKSLTSPRILRYGAGSPFMDMKLPCGGAMDILLVPNPDPRIFSKAWEILSNRKPVALKLGMSSGSIALSDAKKTKQEDGFFHWLLEPALKFCVFGNGYEASSFAELVDGAGYPLKLYSTNAETLDSSRLTAANTHLLNSPTIPDISEIDEWTSVTLFFHDHDLEERILIDALKTPAFYIGAQGSFTTHLARKEILLQSGATEDNIARIHGPIGLIPKVRDPKTLAISVLAEIHAVALKDTP